MNNARNSIIPLAKLHFRLLPTCTASGRQMKINRGSRVPLALLSAIISNAFLLPDSQWVTTTKTAALTHCWPASRHLWQAPKEALTLICPYSFHTWQTVFMAMQVLHHGSCIWSLLPFLGYDHWQLLPSRNSDTFAEYQQFQEIAVSFLLRSSLP